LTGLVLSIDWSAQSSGESGSASASVAARTAWKRATKSGASGREVEAVIRIPGARRTS
jgi:hypothetical protein